MCRRRQSPNSTPKVPYPDPSAACILAPSGLTGAASLLESAAASSGSTPYLLGLAAAAFGTVAELSIAFRGVRR